MAIFCFGISHKTAPVSIREKIAFSSEQLADATMSLQAEHQVNEAVIVSTCNRTEIYASGELMSKAQVCDWLAKQHALDSAELNSVVYHHEQGEAIRHLMAVACGLDSMILGEPQILGQLKSAFSDAEQSGGTGSVLHRLFDSAFSVAKEVRSNTDIGKSAVSVAYAAVSLAKHIFADLSEVTILLVGAGETTELVATHLIDAGAEQLTVCNRSIARASDLADKFNAKTATLTQIPELLPHVDIVVSSTASPLPLIGKGMVEDAIKQRRNQPMFLVDLAVPRDIESQVNDLDNVYLYTVDDLQGIVEKNQQQRQEAAKLAEQMIQLQLDKFSEWLQQRGSVNHIRSYREKSESIRTEALARALKQLQDGGDPEKVVAELSVRLTNKLMHSPTAALRAATKQDKHHVEFVAKAFGLGSD